MTEKFDLTAARVLADTAGWRSMDCATIHHDWLKSEAGLHTYLLGSFYQPKDEQAEPVGSLEITWVHSAYLSASGWMLNTRGFKGVHGNASFPLSDATHWRSIYTPDTPDPLATALRGACDEVERLRKMLASALDVVAMARDHYHAECAESDDGERHILPWERLEAHHQQIRVSFMDVVAAQIKARAMLGDAEGGAR